MLAEALIDPSKILRVPEFQDALHCIDEFERRFPQIKVTVFLGELPEGVDVNGAAVWLLNQGVVTRQNQIHPAEWTLAVIITPACSQASIGVGYALEHLLPGAVVSSVLGSVRHHLWHREYGRAVRGILDGCQKHLLSHGTSRPRQLTQTSVSGANHLGLRPLGTQDQQEPEKTISF